MSVSKLYLIATPLGNLEDITLRALSTLKGLDFIFAEDSRELAKLLQAHGISSEGKKFFSYSNHNMKESTEKALHLLKEGHDVGLVTDRGTPCLSDPGYLLVARAREAGHVGVPIPGATSVAAVLSVAGVDVDNFLFLGFLPLQNKERLAVFDKVSSANVPTVFFESARRVRETLTELATVFPQGQVFLGREMTKLFESFEWQSLAMLKLDAVVEKGEFALVLVPGAQPGRAPGEWEEEVDLRLLSEKEWAKRLAARHGVPAKSIYNALQKRKSQ